MLHPPEMHANAFPQSDPSTPTPTVLKFGRFLSGFSWHFSGYQEAGIVLESSISRLTPCPVKGLPVSWTVSPWKLRDGGEPFAKEGRGPVLLLTGTHTVCSRGF